MLRGEKKNKEGAIHWSVGASLAISSTGILFGHPVLEEREGGRLRLVGPASSMDGCNEVLYIGVNFAKLVGMTWHGLNTPHVPYIRAALRKMAKIRSFQMVLN